MRKIEVSILALLFLTLPGQSLASSATAITESQVKVGEGKAQVYQSVETTVNGQTVKKESTQPGKLELEMRKVGEGSPTVTFSQETQEEMITTPSQEPTVRDSSAIPEGENEEGAIQTILLTIQNFFRGFFERLLGIF